MPEYKKKFHPQLVASFVLGRSAAEAAKDAGCSEPTARKFRNANSDEIRSLQRQSSEGVLDALKKLLPEAVQTLETHLKACDTTRGSVEAVRVVRAIFEAFDLMRDVEMERRMAALEKRLGEIRDARPQGEAAAHRVPTPGRVSTP